MSVETGRLLEIPYPDTDQLVLRIRSGPCKVSFHPAAMDAWVSASGSTPLRFEERGGDLSVLVAPEFDGPVPALELGIGTARAFELHIDTFGSGNFFELGGLPITRLEAHVSQGPTTFSFETPNPVPMSRLHLEVAGGQLDGKGLCRAGFTELLIDGGHASLRLDMTGELMYDATARVATTGGHTYMVIPESVPAEVSGHGLFGTPRVSGHFSRIADLYLNPRALAGDRPLLRVQNSMAMGTFQAVSA